MLVRPSARLATLLETVGTHPAPPANTQRRFPPGRSMASHCVDAASAKRCLLLLCAAGVLGATLRRPPPSSSLFIREPHATRVLLRYIDRSSAREHSGTLNHLLPTSPRSSPLSPSLSRSDARHALPAVCMLAPGLIASSSVLGGALAGGLHAVSGPDHFPALRKSATPNDVGLLHRTAAHLCPQQAQGFKRLSATGYTITISLSPPPPPPSFLPPVFPC